MTEPTWRDLFLEGWRYDLYANLAWLDPVVQHGSEQDKWVFWHVLAASKIWATRLTGVSPTAMPEVPLTWDAIHEIHAAWVEVLGYSEFDQVVDYQNTRGDAFSRRVGDIVRHALNHGTYHRGQLRESFGHRGLSFPETDFIGFAAERDLGLLS